MGRYSTYSTQRVRLHVVAVKALLLGIVLTISMLGLFHSKGINDYEFRVSAYTALNCIFHLLEFFITAMCNTEEVDDDSFILNDPDLYYVYIAALLEAALKTRQWRFLPQFTNSSFLIGLSIIVFGQLCRSIAMYTAGVSFHHYVQREHSQKRRLVTWGIYKYLRHPSYFGYFWWFVGSQILLVNPIIGCLGAYKLHQFFKNRIEYEEEFLLSFFGKEYEKYRHNVSTKIPFIP